MARTYRELLVWQKAKALAVHTYKATADFPRTETYGLVSQIRRAAVSVPSNIAEGQGRLTSGEFRHFLGQARGSLLEAETQLAIAPELGFWIETITRHWISNRTKYWGCLIGCSLPLLRSRLEWRRARFQG